MIKEFVPYPEALELKELGFDEPTLYHWHSSCKTHPFTNEICNPNCRPKTNSGIKSIGEENHVWSAPTFSQAFRWFRKKGYDVKVEKESAEVYFGFWWTGVAWSSIEPGTYEEAELACLRKLISTVKQRP